MLVSQTGVIMELRRFGDSILRSRTSPLLSFLDPFVSTPSFATTTTSHPLYAALAHVSTCRRLPTTNITRQYASSSATKATTNTGPSNKNGSPREPSSDADNFTSPIDKLLSDTLLDRPSPGGTLGRTSEYNDPFRIGLSSSDSVTNAYESQIYGKKRPKPGALASAMEMPTSPPPSGTRLSKDIANEYIHSQEPATRAALTIRSRPSVGRTVEINPERGVDLGRGLKSLAISCALNNVRVDAARQKFHERPGLKRKRLKSERWRKRFKIGFQHVVQKVKVMRRKGW